MLHPDTNKRITINDALSHPFFKRFFIQVEVQKDKLFDFYKNIRSFKTDKKSFFQHAAYSYMVHNLTKKEDIIDIRKLFIQFDDDCSGSLTVDEIVEGLKKVIPTNSDKEKLMENLNNLNQSQSGGFEYGEFFRLFIDRKQFLTTERIKETFNLLDKDESGSISPDEFEVMLGLNSDYTKADWELIIQQIDINKDGSVSIICLCD